jgi:hypothetical protein
MQASSGEVYEVVLEGRQENQQVLNVMFFRAATASDSVETRLLRALVICWLTQMVPALATSYSFIRCTGKRVVPDLGPVLESFPITGDVVAGAATGGAEPTFVSALISIRTTRGGRSGKGRIFVPGVPEIAKTDSFILTSSAFWIALANYIACVVATFITSGDPPPANTWDIGVMSRKIGGTKPPFTADGFAPAISLAPRTLLASTNSRKIGHGK